MEDSTLYPQLATHPSEAVRESAAKFQFDMEKVKSDFESYKKNWYNPQAIISNPQNFIIETKQVLASLALRMKKEETDFYNRVESFQKF